MKTFNTLDGYSVEVSFDGPMMYVSATNEATGEFTKLTYLDGLLHGPSSEKLRPGHIISQNYRLGKPFGESKRWAPNGTLIFECNYNENGRYHGRLIERYNNGETIVDAVYQDGIKTGCSNSDELYNRPNDEKEKELGRRVEYTGEVRRVYSSTGQMVKETHYRNGINHGPHRCWDQDGNLAVDMLYDNGHRHGTFRSWHRGILDLEIPYWHGEIDGIYRFWDLDGNLVIENTYENGQLDGHNKEWHDDGGPVRKITPWKYGKRHGVKQKWDKKGNLELTEFYLFGFKVSMQEYVNFVG